MNIKLPSSFGSHLDKDISAAVRETLQALAGAAISISHICARGPLEASLGESTGNENADGDAQKALDVRADELIIDALGNAPVAYYASEERDDILCLNEGTVLAVASDPLDGSSNIDTNVSIGTIFSIYRAERNAAASFFRKGSDQLAGGFFIYGPQTTLVMTAGTGTQLYVLDRTGGVFTLAIPAMQIIPDSREYAINASNYQHWKEPVRRYIEDCQMGAAGPMGRKMNMRWVGSLVADANRILMRGGVFLYPSDDRKGYEKGRLRLLYEGAPVAFVIEQAGGSATDGRKRILDIALDELHQRVPLVYGSKGNVQCITKYHAQEN